VVASGHALLAPCVTWRLIEEFARRPAPALRKPQQLDSLTERELEVLGELARGLTKRGDRFAAVRERSDRQDARRSRAGEAGAPRSGAGREPCL
jgi:hypothetical protein